MTSSIDPVQPIVRSRIVTWLLWTIAIGFLGTMLAGVAFIAFVFSVGTASVTLDVTATVIARDTKRPVPGCAIILEQQPHLGFGVTRLTTDAQGRFQHKVGDSYGGSLLSFVDREIELEVMLYLGDAPREVPPDEAETWLVYLRFDDPWFDSQVAADARLERVATFESAWIGDQFRAGGTRPLPLDADAVLTPVTLTIGEGREGFRIYQVPLTFSLTAAQIAACQSAR